MTAPAASPDRVPGGVREGRLPADQLREMFDGIAPVYDAMNRVMTAGLDRRWRDLAARDSAVQAHGCPHRAVSAFGTPT